MDGKRVTLALLHRLPQLANRRKLNYDLAFNLKLAFTGLDSREYNFLTRNSTTLGFRVHESRQFEMSEVGSVPSENSSSTRLSLLLRVRDFDDSEAWRDFVDIYAPRVFTWCKGLGLQDVDASDAAQTVLLKLVNTIRDFEYDPNKGSFRSWLKTIACNTANDIHRNWRHRGAADSAIAKLLEEVPEQTNMDSLVGQIEQAYRDELIAQASSRVKLRVRSATWQAYRRSMVDQIPAVQVADELGISVADVYVAKSRVIKMLREEARRLDPEAEIEN